MKIYLFKLRDTKDVYLCRMTKWPNRPESGGLGLYAAIEDANLYDHLEVGFNRERAEDWLRWVKDNRRNPADNSWQDENGGKRRSKGVYDG